MKKIFLSVLVIFTIIHADFSKSGGVVTDSSTGLQWQDNAVSGTMTWTAAIDYCEALSLDGHSDWRLPNINELTSLVDDTKMDPSINPVFEYTASNYYWSSTTYAGHTYYAWYVNFSSGYQYYDYKDGNRYVRCVRAGQ